MDRISAFRTATILDLDDVTLALLIALIDQFETEHEGALPIPEEIRAMLVTDTA